MIIDSLMHVFNVAMQANEMFNHKNEQSVTTVGILNTELRMADVNANAVCIDCSLSNQRVTLLIKGDNPENVNVVVGMKGSYNPVMVKQTTVDNLTAHDILEIIEIYFHQMPS